MYHDVSYHQTLRLLQIRREWINPFEYDTLFTWPMVAIFVLATDKNSITMLFATGFHNCYKNETIHDNIPSWWQILLGPCPCSWWWTAMITSPWCSPALTTLDSMMIVVITRRQIWQILDIFTTLVTFGRKLLEIPAKNCE